MANKPATTNGYHPDMDAVTHEKTYDGFVDFATIGTIVTIGIVVALAIGGLKGAWGMAVLAVLIISVAGTIGMMAKGLSWRAPAAGLALLLLMFLAA